MNKENISIFMINEHLTMNNDILLTSLCSSIFHRLRNEVFQYLKLRLIPSYPSMLEAYHISLSYSIIFEHIPLFTITWGKLISLVLRSYHGHCYPYFPFNIG